MALEVPAYSSLPGADHTIYLDFDGHITENYPWIGFQTIELIDSPAYSTDTDLADFSVAEKLQMNWIWARVAEDFAPFNVNVTTVEPPLEDLRKAGSNDTRWGIRVVVTQNTAFPQNYAGVAHFGSFNWDSDTPVFAINMPSYSVPSTKAIADTVSHEVGHSLGLSHDGRDYTDFTSEYYSGHGFGSESWAPIMGMPFSGSVTQWDRGEYLGSNNGGTSANFGNGPDDLTVITTKNGFGFRPDMVGNVQSMATPLTSSGTAVSANGIIETRDDVDYFSFITGSGTVSLNITTALGANLDVKADLYNSAGNLVATSSSLTSLNAAITATVSQGVYYLKIDGVGIGNPLVFPPAGYTDYGSIGQYKISGTIVPTLGSAVSVVAASAMKPEGDGGTTDYTFDVIRSGNTSQYASVGYSVASSGPNPASPADFVPAAFQSGVVEFMPGDVTRTITIPVRGESAIEADETFLLTLNNSTSNLTIAASSAIGTIKNDDHPRPGPTISIAAVSLTRAEGTGTGPTSFTFRIDRTGSLHQTASVRYSVFGSGSNPASNSDFATGFPTNVQVNFPEGVASKLVTLNVNADDSIEANEKFVVALSNPIGAEIAAIDAYGWINNDDIHKGGPVKTIMGSGMGAGHDDSEACHRGADAPGTEQVILYADPIWVFYPHQHLTPEELAVPAMKWIDGVPCISDMDHEHGHGHQHEGDDWHWDEFVDYNDDMRGFGRETETGFHTDDGSNELTASDWVDVNGVFDTTASGDETISSINPGASAISRIGVVDEASGSLDEADEREDVEIYDSDRISGSIAPSIGLQSSFLVFEQSASKLEGQSGMTAFTFYVHRQSDNMAYTTDTISYAVVGVGANPASPADFVGGVFPSGTITFPPAQFWYEDGAMQTITIPVRGDTVVEATEKFAFTLFNLPMFTDDNILTAVGTIYNDDSIPTTAMLSITADNLSRSEGTGAAYTPFTFSITRFGGLGETVSVQYSVVGVGTASPANGGDFASGLPTNVEIVFDPFVAGVLITLDVVADSVWEPNEKFRVVLSNPVNGSIAIGSAEGVIKNDDSKQWTRIGGSPADGGVKIAQIWSAMANGRGFDESDSDRMVAISEPSRADVMATSRTDVTATDPLWMLNPPRYPAPDRMAVPMTTWIAGDLDDHSVDDAESNSAIDDAFADWEAV